MVKIVLYFALTALSLCSIIALIRFVKGPSLPDRVTAFDLFAAIVISMIVIYSEVSENNVYLDVAILLSLITFLGSMSFAYFILKRPKNS
jgi:multicomponent Na+:H+ antiporter subunit F